MARSTSNVKSKLTIFVAALVVATSQQSPDKRCNGVNFGGRYYDAELLKDGLNKVSQLTLNTNDNVLYFVFQKDEYSAVGYLNITSGNVGVINGVRNACTVAIDQQYNKVYVGGDDGIYKINSNNLGTPEKLRISDNIQSMYFKDVLFYTNRLNQAYMYENGHINEVFELRTARPEKIILDDDHNIFYTRGKQLFRVRLGTLAENPHERYRTNVLTTDFDGKPYILTNDGVFTYNKYKYAFDKVSEFSDLKALTFNKVGDPIYCVVDQIVKLNENPNKCYEPFVF